MSEYSWGFASFLCFDFVALSVSMTISCNWEVDIGFPLFPMADNKETGFEQMQVRAANVQGSKSLKFGQIQASILKHW